jgi:hypothetical protein
MRHFRSFIAQQCASRKVKMRDGQSMQPTITAKSCSSYFGSAVSTANLLVA